jgi:DNA mismatch repair ATPase MutS
LAEIEQSFGHQVCNVHFQDELHDGRISFDYQLRPGVVTKSNGLALMRSIGLDV